jgi:hypothetical protein
MRGVAALRSLVTPCARFNSSLRQGDRLSLVAWAGVLRCLGRGSARGSSRLGRVPISPTLWAHSWSCAVQPRWKIHATGRSATFVMTYRLARNQPRWVNTEGRPSESLEIRRRGKLTPPKKNEKLTHFRKADSSSSPAHRLCAKSRWAITDLVDPDGVRESRHSYQVR